VLSRPIWSPFVFNIRACPVLVLNTGQDHSLVLNTVANRSRSNFLGVWLSDSAKAAIDAEIKATGANRSEVVRRMLAYAVWKMPKGWKP
jgi:hypothetical protein